ncbi:hypothetical protein HDV00_003267 [Rhizophlyctis rosea]|nr:hypothetical protein HDV00_003267 [Rhizophlyctis rosea]
MPPKKAGKKKKSSKTKASTADLTSNAAHLQPTWPGALDPEAFAARAAQLQSALQNAAATSIVTLRVRQLDWEYHDFLVSLPKTARVYELMRIIAQVQHGGAVKAEDVGIWRGDVGAGDGAEKEGGLDAGVEIVVGDGGGANAAATGGGSEEHSQPNRTSHYPTDTTCKIANTYPTSINGAGISPYDNAHAAIDYGKPIITGPGPFRPFVNAKFARNETTVCGRCEGTRWQTVISTES